MGDDRDPDACTNDTNGNECKKKEDHQPAFDALLTAILNTPPEDLPPVEPDYE